MRNLGPVSYFLGINITYEQFGLHLSQAKCARDLLQKSGMADYKSVASPIVLSAAASPTHLEPFDKPALYRQLAGSLQYLTITQPDLALAVNKVCQKMHHPLVANFQKLKRIIRYVRGTLYHGLRISKGDLSLHAYADADWAGDSIDCRSTTGYFAFLGPNLISWSIKKQSTVVHSSTEAEYRALTTAATDII